MNNNEYLEDIKKRFKRLVLHFLIILKFNWKYLFFNMEFSIKSCFNFLFKFKIYK